MLIDTHIFIWYIQDHPNLSKALKEKMSRDPEKVFLPSICLWEVLLLAEKGRIEFVNVKPAEYLRECLQQTGFREVPLNSEIVFLSRTLPFDHDDPADRFIAATSKFLNMKLATADARLKSLWWLKTIDTAHP